MSMFKAALLGLMIPAALVLPAMAEDGPPRGPQMVFETLDLDGDGMVTLEEMEGARVARFAEADANGDGLLDRDELMAGGSERMARGIDRMMDRADADGDGALSQEELAGLRSGRRGPEAIFQRFDADGDGSLSAAEFEQAAEAMRERRGGHGGPFGNRDRG
jgi:Ca2+-binding EF-hand superfamily protein